MVFSHNNLVPELWCSDFEESLSFYTCVLGFSVVQRHDNNHHAYLSLQGSQVMITSFAQDGTWETGSFEKPYGRGINISIRVNNLNEIHQAIIAANLKPFVDLYEVSYWTENGKDNRIELAVLDPNGYLFRFYQRADK